MAVTTQNSSEYTNRIATPLVTADAVNDKGKLRSLTFTHDQDGVGDAGSIVRLGKLPAGKVKILGGLSRFYCNWTASSQTMDIGWEAYYDPDGTAVAVDVDGLVDGLDVDAVGYFDMEGNTASGKLLGGNYTFESRDGVIITAKAIGALADGDDLAGVITYIVD